MKLKEIAYFVPFIGLVAYTVGAFFLLGTSPPNLFLAPGSGSIKSIGAGIGPFIALVVSGALLLAMVISGRKVK